MENLERETLRGSWRQGNCLRAQEKKTGTHRKAETETEINNIGKMHCWEANIQ